MSYSSRIDSSSSDSSSSDDDFFDLVFMALAVESMRADKEAEGSRLVKRKRNNSIKRDREGFLDMKGAKGKGAAKKDSLKPVDDKKVGKRKATAKDASKKKAKGAKAAKDPNKPKRPPSAFFVFLEEFRKTFKKENPHVKAVSAVGKAGGEKWKSMTAAEKAPYEAKAAKRKNDYEKLMNAYNKKQENMDEEDEESEKSKSEVDEESGQDGGDDEDEEEDEDEDDD